ncbi:MAG: TlpA family protein disulfide reductase [Gemmataceae bacterium]|nr:TlpA family protein disulfide reductase [Gemmataceae bacterium]
MLRPCLAVGLFAAAAVGLADDPKPPTPAEKLAALKAAKEAVNKWFEESQKAWGDKPDKDEFEKKAKELMKALREREDPLLDRAVELAKADPKSDFALEALEWALTEVRPYKPAIDLAREHHASNPKVGKIAGGLGQLVEYLPPEDAKWKDVVESAWVFLDAVAKTNPDKTARAQAELAFAMKARRAFDAAEGKKAADAERLAAETERAFEKLARDYGGCKRLIGPEDAGTVGEAAAAELFVLRNLRVGKVVPEIGGEDLDGKPLKLSEASRGNVTVLIFWASWCKPCMELVPHEKKLAERHKDKPFVLVGVNLDDDRAKAKQTTEKEGMGWRSFWAGPKAWEGPIPKAWNIREIPTVYVIDATGVIRARGHEDLPLDAAVDAALKDAGKK